MSLTKNNTLPVLGKIWDQDPLFAAILILILDFWIVWSLMFLESIGPNSIAPPPWHRTHYKSFLFGDSIAVPIFLFAAMSFMAKHPFGGHYWFMAKWFQAIILIVGIAAVIYMNVIAARTNDATISQLLSPSLLFHTLVFGPMVYWIAVSALGALASIWENQSLGVATVFQTAILLIPVVIHLGLMYWDAILPRPWTAHVEGSWLRWDWHVRPR